MNDTIALVPSLTTKSKRNFGRHSTRGKKYVLSSLYSPSTIHRYLLRRLTHRVALKFHWPDLILFIKLSFSLRGPQARLPGQCLLLCCDRKCESVHGEGTTGGITTSLRQRGRGNGGRNRQRIVLHENKPIHIHSVRRVRRGREMLSGSTTGMGLDNLVSSTLSMLSSLERTQRHNPKK